VRANAVARDGTPRYDRLRISPLTDKTGSNNAPYPRAAKLQNWKHWKECPRLRERVISILG
jgi:hypothetical protein